MIIVNKINKPRESFFSAPRESETTSSNGVKMSIKQENIDNNADVGERLVLKRALEEGNSISFN